MNKRALAVAIITAAILPLAYMNCSQVKFTSAPGNDSGSPVDGSGNDTGNGPGNDSDPGTGGGGQQPPGLPGGQPPNTGGGGDTTAPPRSTDPYLPVPPGAATEVLKKCQEAAAKGTLQTMDEKIVFNDTRTETGKRQICEFNKGENLDMLNSFLRARYEQYRSINLPQGTVICDLELSTDLTRFRYDDVFFLSYNGVTLASNLDLAVKKSTSSNVNLGSQARDISVYHYDWLKARGTNFDQTIDYCLGQKEGLSTCKWPRTEQTGPIAFDFDQELLVNIALRRERVQEFGFAITGDNDPELDCFHEELSLALKVKYIVP